MLEISLIVTIVFLLVAIFTSYLLRDAIEKPDNVDSGSIEKTQLLALGMRNRFQRATLPVALISQTYQCFLSVLFLWYWRF